MSPSEELPALHSPTITTPANSGYPCTVKRGTNSAKALVGPIIPQYPYPQ